MWLTSIFTQVKFKDDVRAEDVVRSVDDVAI